MIPHRTSQLSGRRGRALAAAVGGVALIAVAAGCSSSPAETAEPSDDGASGAPASDQSITIWADAVFADTLDSAADAFEAEYGITVDVQPTEYASIVGSYLQAGPAGTGPDLVDVNIDHLGPITDAGLAAPLDLGDRLQDVDERARAGYTVDGQLHGLPLVIESSNMWRNPDLVPDTAETWTDVREIGLDLLDQGVEYPVVIDMNAYIYNDMMTAFGGYVFGQNADGSYDTSDVGLDNEGAVDSLEYLAQAVDEGWVQEGLDQDTINQAWEDGEIGLYLSGPWNYGTFSGFDTPFSIDMVPAGPAGPGVPWISARGLVVNPLSDNAALAATFLTDYLAQDEPMAQFALETGKESAWLPVQDTATTEATAAFAAAGANAQPIPQDAELSGYWAAMEDALAVVMNGTATPQEAAEAAAAQLRDSVEAQQ